VSFKSACLALLVGLWAVGSPAWAQPSTSPSWNQLTPAQREALAPLSDNWAGFDSDRKRKWLEVAAKYPNLSPEGKQKLHERMAGFARLTPEQKTTARENFRRAYQVPAEQREATVQKYNELPEDKKRELAGRTAAKPETPRRTTRESAVPPANPPARTPPQQ
jgi:hypothetical protein